VWPAGIEPADAPRFRRALYRLSYGHIDGRGWSRTSDLLFVRQALIPSELLARESVYGATAKWARLESNQRPLPYQRSALPFELLARRAPGQGLEPRSPRPERGVLPIGRSRIGPMEGGV
jgi:hypothetical protein